MILQLIKGRFIGWNMLSFFVFLLSFNSFLSLYFVEILITQCFKCFSCSKYIVYFLWFYSFDDLNNIYECRFILCKMVDWHIVLQKVMNQREVSNAENVEILLFIKTFIFFNRMMQCEMIKIKVRILKCLMQYVCITGRGLKVLSHSN